VENANAAALRLLKQLAGELSGNATKLAAAVQLSDLITALLYHSRTVRASGWSVPYVGVHEQQQYLQEKQGLGSAQQVSATGQLQQQAAGESDSSSSNSSSSSSSLTDSSSRGQFALKEFWPFWMVGGDNSTIKNDVTLDGFILLTGPNMAGEHKLWHFLHIRLSVCLPVCLPVCLSVCLSVCLPIS
jgi:hypothetical protein